MVTGVSLVGDGFADDRKRNGKAIRQPEYETIKEVCNEIFNDRNGYSFHRRSGQQ